MPFNMENLKEKVGPLPEWAWITILAGGGYYLYRKHTKAGTPTQTNTTANTGGNTAIDPLTGIPYNQEGNGYTGALLTAQYNQLNQEGLLTSQLGILDSGITAQTGATGGNTAALGTNTAAVSSNTAAVNSNTAAVPTKTPPNGNLNPPPAIPLVPVVNAPAPVAPPPAASPVAHNQHIYTVVKGDTLTGIANKIRSLWGVNETWQSIYAANKGVIGANPGQIYPGQQFLVGS